MENGVYETELYCTLIGANQTCVYEGHFIRASAAFVLSAVLFVS
jgi:hypothetical protein